MASIATTPARGGLPFGNYDYEALYRTHSAAVYNRLRVGLGDPLEAEDLTQKVFERAWIAIGSGTRPINPRAWLLRIARNVLIDHVREHSRMNVADAAEIDERRERLVEPARAPGSAWISDAQLALYCERLPHREHQVLMLVHLGEFSAAEIAGVVGTTPAGVWKLHSNALRRLRKLVAHTPSQEYSRRAFGMSSLLAGRSLLRGQSITGLQCLSPGKPRAAAWGI
jgi:RNA polymerase sigma-70 factor (ECF subfamily)